MQIAPYDGCAEFHAESAEKFVAFMRGVYASSHLVGMHFALFYQVSWRLS